MSGIYYSFESQRCVDTRPAKISPQSLNRPRNAADRLRMVREYGRDSFLLPDGTPRTPLPSFPIVSARTGCFHCGLMRMQYTRIGSAMATADREYRSRLNLARRRLIRLALELADRDDPGNSCNFAYRAAERYL